MNRAGSQVLGGITLNIPVAAGENMKEYTIAAINADGYAVVGKKAEGLVKAGMVTVAADNTGGAAGAATVRVKRGTFVWNNDGTIKNTDLLKTCYIAGADTVTITAEKASAAGTIIAVDQDGVTVEMK